MLKAAWSFVWLPEETRTPKEKHIFWKNFSPTRGRVEDGGPIDPARSDGEGVKQAGNPSCLSRIKTWGSSEQTRSSTEKEKEKKKWPIHGTDEAGVIERDQTWA